MTDQQFLIFANKSLMILDHVFGQFDSNSLQKLISTVDLSRILNYGDFFLILIVVGKIDMSLSDSMPIEKSLSTVSEV